MNHKRELIRSIANAPSGFSSYQFFSDFVEITTMVIVNNISRKRDEVYYRREDRYKNIIQKYKDGSSFVQMFKQLTMAAEENMEDILGEVYMASGCGDKNTGQFFTPYHISKTIADMMQENDDTRLKLYEPSCGSGGMIIAYVAAMKEAGINYTRRLQIVAQDLEWRAVYMCYIQLSLYGVDAVVVQGDALSAIEYWKYPEEQIFRTPANRGMLI